MQRMFAILIVWPGTIVLCIGLVCYDFSFGNLTLDITHQMDEFARMQQSPPDGFVTIKTCHKPEGPPEPKKLVCDQFDYIQKGVKLVASEEARFLRQIYWLLVFCSLVTNYILLGPRRFFLLDIRPRAVLQAQASTENLSA